jgi:cobalt/nickel transport system permease protein
MHIMEGYLPHPWWEFWLALSLPVVVFGASRLSKLIRDRRELLPLIAVSGAFIFVFSSLKLPSVNGSCSHPTGPGLSSIFFGPGITSVLAAIVLVYQALFLAHGGLTTLESDVFSIGIAGPIVGIMIYEISIQSSLNLFLAVFLAAALADLTTYLVTSLQLALALPASSGGVPTSFTAFATVFAIMRLPLTIMECVVTARMFKYILQAKSDMLLKVNVIPFDNLVKIKETWA